MFNQIEIDCDSKILITGGSGLVGRALVKELKEQGFTNVISIGSKDCDLRNLEKVKQLFNDTRPKYVFHLAARVHGLGGNTMYKSDILVDNVLINTNVVEQSRLSGVDKIVAMGSGCVYPELSGKDELFEDQIWLGPPHSSENSYAHSKRMMLAQLDAAREQYGLSSAFVISGNLYGEGDNFNTNEGHVTPSLIAKFFDAKRKNRAVKVWGTGKAIRDFCYSGDAARALIAILGNVDGAINMGSGQKHCIRDIVDILYSLTGVPIEWDSSKPDGQLVRYYNLDLLDKTGFVPKVSLREGIERTYNWYTDNFNSARR